MPYDGGEVIGYLRVPEPAAQPAPGPSAAPGRAAGTLRGIDPQRVAVLGHREFVLTRLHRTA